MQSALKLFVAAQLREMTVPSDSVGLQPNSGLRLESEAQLVCSGERVDYDALLPTVYSQLSTAHACDTTSYGYQRCMVHRATCPCVHCTSLKALTYTLAR